MDGKHSKLIIHNNTDFELYILHKEEPQQNVKSKITGQLTYGPVNGFCSDSLLMRNCKDNKIKPCSKKSLIEVENFKYGDLISIAYENGYGDYLFFHIKEHYSYKNIKVCHKLINGIQTPQLDVQYSFD